MMNISVSVSRDLSQSSRYLAGYRVTLRPTEDAQTNTLRQHPEVWNNVARWSGVMPTTADAARAVLDLVNAPCSLRERTDELSGEARYSIEPLGSRPALAFGWTARILASRTPNGLFVASDGDTL